MNSHDAASIKAVPPESLRDPALVNAIIEQIRSVQGAGQRRLMLRALVERLIAADQPEAAASCATSLSVARRARETAIGSALNFPQPRR